MSAAQIDMATRATNSPVPAVAKRPLGTNDRGTATAQCVGIALVAIVPAVFWTACIWLACRAWGVAITHTSLALFAASIIVFLTVIGSALTASR
jgi:hypothetical protein